MIDNPFLILIILLIIVGYLVFKEKLTRYYFPDGETSSVQAEMLKLIVQSAGILVIILGLFSSFSQINKLSEQNEIIRKGQVEERFKNSIDHLGSEKVPVVLGAVYELFHIAKSNNSYSEMVFNILCSYLREITSKTIDRQILIRKNTEYKEYEPPIVVQTIIDLLFKGKGIEIFDGLKADLHGANLQGVDFTKASIKNANLMYIKLNGAYLKNANFKGSSLYKASINGAVLTEANFENTILSEASLNRATCVDSKFSGSNIDLAYLVEADFTRAELIGVNFIGSYMLGINLLNANLQGAFIVESHLEGGNLLGTFLEGADFDSSYLDGACVLTNNIAGTNFRNTSMKGAVSSPIFQIGQNNFIKRLRGCINKETISKNLKKGGLSSKRKREIISLIKSLRLNDSKTNEIISRISKADSTNFNGTKFGKLSINTADDIIRLHSFLLE